MIEEEKAEVKIGGARIHEKEESKVWMEKVEHYREEHDIFIQLFDPEYIINEEHIWWAYNKALDTFSSHTNRAQSLEIETILWASGEHQIKDALKKLGIKDGAESVVILMDDSIEEFINFMGWEKDEKLLENSLKKLRRFGLSEKEIESTNKPYDLIYEKMCTAIL